MDQFLVTYQFLLHRGILDGEDLNFKRGPLKSVLMQTLFVYLPRELGVEFGGITMFDHVCTQMFRIEVCLHKELVVRTLRELSTLRDPEDE